MWKKIEFLKGKYFRIYRPKKNKEGEFEVKTNEELRRLFEEANIIRVMKSNRIRWLVMFGYLKKYWGT